MPANIGEPSPPEIRSKEPMDTDTPDDKKQLAQPLDPELLSAFSKIQSAWTTKIRPTLQEGDTAKAKEEFESAQSSALNEDLTRSYEAILKDRKEPFDDKKQ